MSEILHLTAIIFHVLGAAVIIGGVFASLLILIKEKVSKDNLEYLRYLWKFLTPAIGFQILTGIYLAAKEWDEFGNNPFFWSKIGLLVVDGFLGGRVLCEKIKSINLKNKKEVTITGAKKKIVFS